MYARINDRWGTDPAAWLEPIDDVLAYNFRVALLTRLGRGKEEEMDPEARKHLEGQARAHHLSEELRRIYG